MAKRTLVVNRQFEVKPTPPAYQESSELEVIMKEMENPRRFATAGLGLGLFVTLVLLPIGLIALPLIGSFMRSLGL